MHLKLNLGCGNLPRDGWTNLDIRPGPGVDVVHDLDRFPYPFADDTFTEVHADYVLEHMADVLDTMRELHRVCRNGAVLDIVVPHFTAHRAFGELTHKRFFSYSSFDNFLVNPGRYERDPRSVNYAPDLTLEMISKEIGFYQKGKRGGRNTRFLAGFDWIFNASPMPLVYERFLCFMIPATQLRFRLRVVKPPRG